MNISRLNIANYDIGVAAEEPAQTSIADSLAERADNLKKLNEAVALYERILLTHNIDYHTAISLSHLNLLIGDGYVSRVRQKKQHYLKAIHYAELAMCSSSGFREGALKGEKPWALYHHLGMGQMEAMAFWINGLYYIYKDCQNALQQMLNFRWIGRARQMTAHMESLDPDWGGGMVHFLWGIYYLAIPESVGGDREKADGCFQKAVDTGPDWPHYRWGRAKYFHVKMQNPNGFTEDINWLLSQDMETLQGHGAWKHFFKADALSLLQKKDDLF